MSTGRTYLRLILGSIDIIYEGFIFANEELPRTPDQDQIGQITTSLRGSTALTGAGYRAKGLWTIAFPSLFSFESEARAENARELWEEYEARRTATPAEDPKILLYDTTQFFRERSPRTRGLVPGETVFATSANRIKYYAQYYVYFERAPVFEIGGGFVLQFREGEATTP